VRNGATWTEQQKLLGDPVASAQFGCSVALSGDTVVVGAFNEAVGGAAYVFVRSGTTWSLEQKLTASNATIADRFGYSVAVSGETVVVGAYQAGSGANENGAAYVFVRNGTTWTEQQMLQGSDSEESSEFASSVSLSGDTALIGSHGKGVGGAAYVFVRSGTTWTERQQLTASDPALGEQFGWSVALSGETALIGAPRDDHPSLFETGAAYVFVRNGSNWTEQQKLTASNPESADYFGQAVALSGNLAIIGAPNKDPDGAAYLFVRSGTTWSEEEQPGPSDPENAGLFGGSAAISGSTALVGAEQSNGGHMIAGGAAHAYGLSQEPQPYCTAGTSASGCQAQLSATGTASATALSGFTRSAATVEGQKDGLFFFGTNGQQANSWGNSTSFQCVVPPVIRTSLLTGTGTAGLCDGVFSLDMNTVWTNQPAKNPGAAAVVQAQLWYRDPFNTANNQATSMSDAIEFTMAP
jgi:hypothetical protein